MASKAQHRLVIETIMLRSLVENFCEESAFVVCFFGSGRNLRKFVNIVENRLGQNQKPMSTRRLYEVTRRALILKHEMPKTRADATMITSFRHDFGTQDADQS